MVDPTSLLSGIMGTIATLYAIFIAIFILVFQSLPTYKKNYLANIVAQSKRKNFNEDYKNQNDLFSKCFTILAWLVVTFEAYNGMLIYFVPDSMFENFNIFLFASYAFFIITLVYIIVFSYAMANYMISFEKGKPFFYNYKPFEPIGKLDFIHVTIFITLSFIILTFVQFGNSSILSEISNSFNELKIILLSLIISAIITLILSWIFSPKSNNEN